MNEQDARELLAAMHAFPGPYTIKAIGRANEHFVDRIVGAARDSLPRAEDVHYSVRSTPHGRHVAVTLELNVLDAAEVLAVYRALQVVEGLHVLL